MGGGSLQHRALASTFPWLTVLLVATAVGTGAVGPAPPGVESGERHGLSEREYAVLWSRDADQRGTVQADEGTIAVETLARLTDPTAQTPPSTAAQWTKGDFEDLESGTNAALAPPDADLSSGPLFRDAHVTAFAVTPGTVLHANGSRRTHYVAPEGTVRAFVDYRLATKAYLATINESGAYRLAAAAVLRTTLTYAGERVATDDGGHRAVLPYDIAGAAHPANGTFRLTATLRARFVPRGGSGETRVRARTVTVNSSLSVRRYDPAASVRRVQYPDGRRGLAVRTSAPWATLSLTEKASGAGVAGETGVGSANGSEGGLGAVRIRAPYRFYTARDPSWTTLVRHNATNATRVPSAAIPVRVHAVPTRDRLTLDPPSTTLALADVWGPRTPGPTGLGQNVSVGAVTGTYVRPRALAVRGVDPNVSVRLGGLVRGVAGAVTERPAQTLTPVRMNVVTNEAPRSDGVLVSVQLLNATSGEPVAPVSNGSLGVVTVAGDRARVSADGRARLRVTDPGAYTLRYSPAGWNRSTLARTVPYTGAATTVRWHPLTTLGGVWMLVWGLAWRLLPVAVAGYAALRLARLLPGARRGHP